MQPRLDADDVPVFDRSAYYYIYAELDHLGKKYLLNNGKWYLVEESFVEDLNRYYAKIPRYKKVLPPFKHDDQTEGRYNQRVASEHSGEYALLDRQNITVPGAVSPIEPCDLYRATKEFIHVKRYGGSSLLSHHFNQGVVSAETFKRMPFFRSEVDKKLPKRHKIANIDAQPKEGEYKVVYAVISEYDEDLSIPFFSKITLRHAVIRLNEIGFSVELAKIDVDELTKKVKIYPPKAKKGKGKAL